jgi:hypothetical protein
MMTFQLAAVEPRIRSAVAAVTPILDGSHPSLSVHNFAPHLGETSLLMLVGRQDEAKCSEAVAQRLLALAAGTAKDLRFFVSGHRLPAQWTVVAVEWLRRHLE